MSFKPRSIPTASFGATVWHTSRASGTHSHPVYAGWGASHFAELWYVFDHLDQSPWRWTSADRKMAEETSNYWVTFARSGNPNGPGLPLWPAFENTQSKVQYLGDPITTEGVLGIDGLRVFDAVYSDVRGKPFGSL